MIENKPIETNEVELESIAEKIRGIKIELKKEEEETEETKEKKEEKSRTEKKHGNSLAYRLY